jgi:transposase-like protein
LIHNKLDICCKQLKTLRKSIMAYSEDLKQRVLAYVSAGGSKVAAARLFSVARATLYIWLAQPPTYQRRKLGPKTGHKIDRAKLVSRLLLAALIQSQPDLLQRQMAQIMGVSASGISHALAAMTVTYKKHCATTHQRSRSKACATAKSTCCVTGGYAQKAPLWCTLMKPVLL